MRGKLLRRHPGPARRCILPQGRAAASHAGSSAQRCPLTQNTGSPCQQRGLGSAAAAACASLQVSQGQAGGALVLGQGAVQVPPRLPGVVLLRPAQPPAWGGGRGGRAGGHRLWGGSHCVLLGLQRGMGEGCAGGQPNVSSEKTPKASKQSGPHLISHSLQTPNHTTPEQGKGTNGRKEGKQPPASLDQVLLAASRHATTQQQTIEQKRRRPSKCSLDQVFLAAAAAAAAALRGAHRQDALHVVRLLLLQCN